jgi:hypothetical protein
MKTTPRVLSAMAVLGAIVTLMARSTPAQSQGAPPHQKLHAAARAANTGDARAIREFTDEIFNQQAGFAEAAESLKDRVSRSEALFRQGLHKPIHEKQMEKVFNDQVSGAFAPSYWRINQSQIKTLRGHRRQMYPGFIEPRAEERHKVPEAMGPAEAAFIAMQLVANKHSNPDFQVEPHEWDQRALERRQNGMMEKSGLYIVASGRIEASGVAIELSPTPTQPPEMPRLQPLRPAVVSSLAFETSLKSEDSEITAAAHRVLDQLKFPR